MGQWRPAHLLRAAVSDLGLSVHWVPAHGRHPEWRDRTLPCSSAHARALNGRAHDACSRELIRQGGLDVARSHWLQECVAARDWARVALTAAASTQACCKLLWTLALDPGG